jgi:hypothetical protein
MSKTAFYRWRSKLLPYGVDIAITRPRLVETETRYLLGAPLKSFIEGPGNRRLLGQRGAPTSVVPKVGLTCTFKSHASIHLIPA